jgi:hypothetical protein
MPTALNMRRNVFRWSIAMIENTPSAAMSASVRTGWVVDWVDMSLLLDGAWDDGPLGQQGGSGDAGLG